MLNESRILEHLIAKHKSTLRMPSLLVRRLAVARSSFCSWSLRTDTMRFGPFSTHSSEADTDNLRQQQDQRDNVFDVVDGCWLVRPM